MSISCFVLKFLSQALLCSARNLRNFAPDFLRNFQQKTVDEVILLGLLLRPTYLVYVKANIANKSYIEETILCIINLGQATRLPGRSL